MEFRDLRGKVVLTAFSVFFCCMTLGCSSKTAEEKGKEMASDKIDLVKGVGAALEEKGGAAAESVTSGLGSIVSGVKKGVAKSDKRVVNDASLAAAGFQVTAVQETPPGTELESRGIDAYLVAERKVAGLLKVTVYDVLDKEIGRTKIPFALDAEQGKYFRIPLEQQIEFGKIEKLSFVFQAS